MSEVKFRVVLVRPNQPKAVDIIKPPSKTELEESERWMNRMETQLRTLPYYSKRKIEVTGGAEQE